MTSEQPAFPQCCYTSSPWPAMKCLSRELYPSEAGVPGVKKQAVPLQPESFLLDVLLASTWRSSAQECLPKEGWGSWAGELLEEGQAAQPCQALWSSMTNTGQ